MRLVDEIVNNSAYLDFGLEQIEYVALSYDSLELIKNEVAKEIKKDFPTPEDIDNALAMKHVIYPSLIGIDYKFFKEIKFL